MANNMQTLGFNVPGMTGTFTVVDAEARKQLGNKLDATALPEAINTALAQAKESGEFDGAPGYTPIKGKDYWNETDKQEIIDETTERFPIVANESEETIFVLESSDIDETLTQKGKVADAKAVGDAIKSIDTQQIINNALAQAKESGEFDGAPGYTPVKDKDYFDGKDGVSPTVAVSDISGGHRVSITDKNGTKAVDVMDGADGSDANVTATNIASALGYTPAKQSDVEQKANKQGLSLGVGGDGLVYLFVDGVAQGNGLDIKAEAVAGDVVGYVDSDNTIILTGALPDGTYTFKYEDDEGKTTDIGSIKLGGPAYINQLPISTDTDGSIFNGTGYKVGYRLNSSSAVVAVGTAGASNPVFVTGFIPVTNGQTVYLENCYIDTDGIDGSPSSTATKNYYGEACSSLNILLCGADKVTKNSVSWVNAKTSEYFTLTPNSDGIVTEFKCNRADLGYIRMVLAGDPANAIITVDQPITD